MATSDKPTEAVAASGPAEGALNPFDKVSDPDNVPVRVVNGIAQIGIYGSLVVMTCTTARVSIGPGGKIEPDNVICARLRLDLEMAKLMRNMLDTQIALLTPSNEKPN